MRRRLLTLCAARRCQSYLRQELALEGRVASCASASAPRQRKGSRGKLSARACNGKLFLKRRAWLSGAPAAPPAAVSRLLPC